MAVVGDRVMIESEKVGVEPRTGVVTAVQGSMVHVCWDEDGQETSFVPAAGSMSVVHDAVLAAPSGTWVPGDPGETPEEMIAELEAPG